MGVVGGVGGGGGAGRGGKGATNACRLIGSKLSARSPCLDPISRDLLELGGNGYSGKD